MSRQRHLRPKRTGLPLHATRSIYSRLLRQYLYFGTSKASNARKASQASNASKARTASES
jgi:hypothetical protein